MKKILVTGSNGLLGQKLIELLSQKENIQLVALSKGENRCKVSHHYSYHSCDLTQHEAFEKVINIENPNVIINTAAMTNVDACELNPEQCNALNVDAVQNIVRICEQKNIFLVHLSTDFIFDGMKSPYDEKATPTPLSHYGVSKMKAEECILKSKVRASILRTAIVYGVVNDMSRTNIVLWAKAALEKKEQIKVVNDQYRCPTLAEDLAQICFLVSEKEAQGIYNATGKDYMCIYEMVERIADFWQLDKSLMTETSSEVLNQPAKRPYKTELKIGKAIQELGYNPRDFEQGLQLINEQLNE